MQEEVHERFFQNSQMSYTFCETGAELFKAFVEKYVS